MTGHFKAGNCFQFQCKIVSVVSKQGRMWLVPGFRDNWKWKNEVFSICVLRVEIKYLAVGVNWGSNFISNIVEDLGKVYVFQDSVNEGVEDIRNFSLQEQELVRVEK